MALTPEEQAQLNREANRAANAATEAVRDAQAALAAPGTAERAAGPSANLALQAAYRQPTAPRRPAQAPSRDDSFHRDMQRVMASLPTDTPSPHPAPRVDEIRNLIANYELEESIATIARASGRSPHEGEQALLNQLSTNPDLMAKFGAHPAQNGRPQSLGNLDLDGGGYSQLEGQAIAAAIADMPSNRNNPDNANSLSSTAFRNRATANMNAMIETAHHSNQSTEVAENTCPRVPLRIIPCPKGGNSR